MSARHALQRNIKTKTKKLKQEIKIRIKEVRTMRLRDKLFLFALNHGKLFSIAALVGFAGLNLLFFTQNASAITYEQFNTAGSSALPQLGVSGMVDTATTWVCYRLAPAAITAGLVGAFWKVKRHDPKGAQHALEVAGGGLGVMAAPSIVHAGMNIYHALHPGP
jgi:hypothetical protein